MLKKSCIKINAIILAAGNSSRFNGNKLLSIYNEKPLAMHIIEKSFEVGFKDIILVTQYSELKEMLKDKDIKIIRNCMPNKGISYSIKLGLKECRNCDGVMFLVCDQPYISDKTMKDLIEIFKENPDRIISSKYCGKLRNPNIFPKKYFKELLELNGDMGGKSIILNNLNNVFEYEIENELEVLDIDTKEDLNKINTLI